MFESSLSLLIFKLQVVNVYGEIILTVLRKIIFITNSWTLVLIWLAYYRVNKLRMKGYSKYSWWLLENNLNIFQRTIEATNIVMREGLTQYVYLQAVSCIHLNLMKCEWYQQQCATANSLQMKGMRQSILNYLQFYFEQIKCGEAKLYRSDTLM